MARNFPEEVITEILSWLPVKSLMRFKCVSKPWLHLISTDPNFMKLHFSRSFHTNNSDPGILVSRKEGLPKTEFCYAEEYTSLDDLTRFAIPFSHPVHQCIIIRGICCDFRFVNVCNGLVCLTDFIKYDSNAYVWNPITGDHVTIPGPPTPSRFFAGEDPFQYGGLSSDTEVVFGFGFNQASDEYKVIRFVSTSDSHVSVYTLGTDSSWRTLQDSLPYGISLYNNSTALVNDSLHWFASKANDPDSDILETLVAFNMEDEIFQEIPQPDGITYQHPFFNVTVGELGGLLSIFCSCQCEYVEIWVMEEYGVADSWRKLWKIVQPNDTGHYWKPLGVAENGEIIISKNTREFVVYDPNTNSVRDLHRFEFQVFDTHTFRASLLSPTIINRASRTID